jgi:hypothetical protein
MAAQATAGFGVNLLERSSFENALGSFGFQEAAFSASPSAPTTSVTRIAVSFWVRSRPSVCLQTSKKAD